MNPPPKWYDTDILGKETRYMIRQMYSKFKKEMKRHKKDPSHNLSLAFAYYDRYMKGCISIMPLIQDMSGIKKLIKEGTKLISPEITK